MADNPRLTMGEALVEGTNASLALNGSGALTLRRHGEQSAEVLLPAQDWPGFGGDCVKALQDHVVRALQTGGAFENTAQDYLNVLRIEEAAYASAAQGAWVRLKT